MENQTASDFDDAITRLQESLEHARDMPGWAVTLVVCIALLCAIILLHVLALMATGPCLWVMWRAKQERERKQLLADEIIEPDVSVELSPAAEAVIACEASQEGART